MDRVVALRADIPSTPMPRALSSLAPAPGPATRMEVLFDTLPATFAPAASAALVASLRGIDSVPVNTIVFPMSDDIPV